MKVGDLLTWNVMLQSEESDGSSVQSSPLTSARVAPKGSHMPPLNLTGSARKGGPAALPTPLSNATRCACTAEQLKAATWRVLTKCN